MKLKSLQQQFQQHLLTGAPEVTSQLAEPRIDIYRTAYFERLIGHMLRVFPALDKLLGREAFRQLVVEYVLSVPSKDPSINTVSAKFSDFLSQSYSEERLWEVLAVFEQHMYQLSWGIMGQDRLNELTQLEAQTLMAQHFTWQPGVKYLCFAADIAQLHHQLLAEAEPDGAIELNEQPSHYLMWNLLGEVYVAPLGEIELLLYRQIEQQKSFEQLCQALADQIGEEQAPNVVAATLQSWFQQGILQLPQ